MKIKRIIGGQLEENGYVVYDSQGGEGYIIDPGYTPEKYLKAVEELEISIRGILLTHHHYDHTGGVEKIRKSLDCPVMIHRLDADMAKVSTDRMLENADKLEFGEIVMEVLHTPGHTAGGVCYWIEKHKVVFTGDTLFNDDIGRTDLEDGSPDDMLNTLKTVVDKWANDVNIYPGHGDLANMKFVRNKNEWFNKAINM